jgi:hypothetical protein
MKFVILALTASVVPAALAREHMNEIKIMEGHTKRSHIVSPLPHR